MKRSLSMVVSLVLLISILAGCGGTQTDQKASGTAKASTAANAQSSSPSIVKTGGSTSVEKVMNSLIYQYQADNQNVTINYEMNGSGDGIKNTMSGLYEIGHSSRELKKDGTEDGLEAIPYAIDGIAVVVNKQNTVADLTKEQIKNIYIGKIKNWKEVGGADALITVVTREASSGTRGAFTELVGLDKKDKEGKIDPATAIVSGATECKDTGAIQTTVSQNPNAIGYMSFSDLDTKKVTATKYEGVEITTENLKNNTYKLKREFLLLTKKGATISQSAQDFIKFILSSEGQKIVEKNKLVTIK